MPHARGRILTVRWDAFGKVFLIFPYQIPKSFATVAGNTGVGLDVKYCDVMVKLYCLCIFPDKDACVLMVFRRIPRSNEKYS
jgi:hypothetical protein